MNYERFDMGSYNLHVIKTSKFKTVTVEVNFKSKLKKDNITLRNLLKSVLLNSNHTFPNERDLIKETENLYDLKIMSANTRIGNDSNLSFKIRFLNEKYTEESMNEYSIAFLMDVLFNPNVSNNSFSCDVVSKCKKRLEKSINSIHDNKLKYTLFKLFESTGDYAYSYNSYGYLEDLDKINSTSLYDYYKNVINNDIVNVFVVGDVDSYVIRELFKKYFKVNTFKKGENDIIVPELKPRKRIKKILLNDSANQSQLTLLCSLNGLTDFERKYVLLVYNELLGGSSSSMLFDTVREKNNYCYYINANQKAYDNIMMIYSGIGIGNSKNVLKLINKTLKDISCGKFSDNLLNNAKETIVSGIKASLDSPSGIINTYYAMELVGSKSFDERMENINKVSREDIINLSKKISVHTLCLLEGDKNECD